MTARSLPPPDGPGGPDGEAGASILAAARRAFDRLPLEERPIAGGADPVSRPAGSTPIGATAAGGVLARALAEPDPEARRRMIEQAIGQGLALGDMEAVGRLLVTDPDAGVRRLAARALLQAGGRVSIPFLARALSDPDDLVRADVVRVAAARGPAAAPLLIPLVTARRFSVTQAAALLGLRQVLSSAELSPAEGDLLLSSVGVLDPPPLDRERAALEGVAHAIGVARLADALDRSADPSVRSGAARLLLAEGGPAAIEALSARADDASEEVRSLAAHAGRQAGHRPQTRDDEMAERSPRSVAVAASHLQEDTPATLVATLAAALADPDHGVREAAASALSSIPSEVLEAWVVQALWSAGEDAPAAAAVAELFLITAAAHPLLVLSSSMAVEIRYPFVTALGALPISPEELIELVGRVDPAHLPAAVRTAWEVGGRPVLPALATLLDNSSGAVRMAALSVLAESGAAWHAELARDRLTNDASAAVRAIAVQTLGSADAEARLDALSRALADPDPDVRATAVERLPEGIESDAAGLLLPALEDEDERVWRASLRHLAALPQQDLVVQWVALRESSPRKREALVRAIEGADAHRLGRLAMDNAGSSSSTDRAMAVDLAARAGTAEATPLVVAALEDPDPVVRRQAAAALSTLRAASAVPALARTLTDPQADVRLEAIRALALIDDDVVPDVLMAALKDPEIRVREMAAEALTRWHSPAVARRLAGALSSPDLRRPASEVLERMGRLAVEPLIEVATGPDPDTAATAGTLLERIAGAQAFVDALASIDPASRLRAVYVLGAIGGPVAAEALTSALTDPDVAVRSRAAMLVGGLHYLPAVKPLRKMFLSDPVGDAAAAAEAALRLLGTVPPVTEDLRLVEGETEDLPESPAD